MLDCYKPDHPLGAGRSHKTDYSCGYGLLEVTNSKQVKTLEKIFKQRTPSDIPWSKIESLLEHIGCTIVRRGDVRIFIEMGSHSMNMHRPHSDEPMPKGLVRRIQDFLTLIEVTP